MTSTDQQHHDDKPTLDPPVRLLKPMQVCGMLGVSKSWLYRAATEGTIPSVRLGGGRGPVRFVATDVRAWLDQRRAGWTPGRSTPAID